VPSTDVIATVVSQLTRLTLKIQLKLNYN